jgi:hypothetical protein
VVGAERRRRPGQNAEPQRVVFIVVARGILIRCPLAGVELGAFGHQQRDAVGQLTIEEDARLKPNTCRRVSSTRPGSAAITCGTPGSSTRVVGTEGALARPASAALTSPRAPVFTSGGAFGRDVEDAS